MWDNLPGISDAYLAATVLPFFRRLLASCITVYAQNLIILSTQIYTDWLSLYVDIWF